MSLLRGLLFLLLLLLIQPLACLESASECSVLEELPDTLAGLLLLCQVEPSRSEFERNNMQMLRWKERYSVSFAQSESPYIKRCFHVASNGSLYLTAKVDREQLCTMADLCCSDDWQCEIPMRFRLAGSGKLAMFTKIVTLIDK